MGGLRKTQQKEFITTPMERISVKKKQDRRPNPEINSKGTLQKEGGETVTVHASLESKKISRGRGGR